VGTHVPTRCRKIHSNPETPDTRFLDDTPELGPLHDLHPHAIVLCQRKDMTGRFTLNREDSVNRKVRRDARSLRLKDGPVLHALINAPNKIDLIGPHGFDLNEIGGVAMFKNNVDFIAR